MTPVLIGQILGVSFACGLNLYLTVAALGLLSRFGIIDALPPGLHGLEGTIVIGSAALLYLIEAVIDKVRHADSLWDAVHTFIRPPAAALLTMGILWGQPLTLAAPAAAIAFFVALTAHGTKAGLRLALTTGMRGGYQWVSVAEDLLAIGFATMAFLDPLTTLIGTATVLALLLLIGPRYWRAFRLGTRALRAWIRTLFSPGRWRELDEIPRRVRGRLDPAPAGTAQPRGAPAALSGIPGAGSYRNGWLVITADGPVFVYRTVLGHRRIELPTPHTIEVDPGVWTDVLSIDSGEGADYTLYMLKDGPAHDVVIQTLNPTVP